MSGNSKAEVPFHFLVSLFEAIARIKPKDASAPQSARGAHPALAILRDWITELRKRYATQSPQVAARIQRLLFPEDDAHRRYDLQEPRLAQYISACLNPANFAPTTKARLTGWSNWEGTGCLGLEVARLAKGSTPHSTLTVSDVDVLLDELASSSHFSGQDIVDRSATSRRTKGAVLNSLYGSLSGPEACYVTQIILKDLRPLLYCTPGSHSTRALVDFNARSIRTLTRAQFMWTWDPSGRMSRVFEMRSDENHAALGHEASLYTLDTHPQVGSMINIPKSAKGRGVAHALSILDDANIIWAETKYDGERAQIHVRYTDDGPCIKIFSKSKRDSTEDRAAVHPIILEALSIGNRENIILDAEMVAYSEDRDAVDEFWRIGGLIANTAHTARARFLRNNGNDGNEGGVANTQTTEPNCHLVLVFFDVLFIGHASLLHVPYSARRSMLESVIKVVPGRSMLAKRRSVEAGRDDSLPMLRSIWAESIADHEEGLVLKASNGRYNDRRLPWVKLKKDYVPGYGDTIDLVLVAAAWEKDRGRELRVPPTTFTTFYIGVLANSSAPESGVETRPHFEVYFTASYGLSREQLEELNFWIRSDTVDHEEVKDAELEYSYSLLPGLPAPSAFVRQPLLAELCGAGFTKSSQSKYYELRFPRITKVFRPAERHWREGLSLRDLDSIALDSVGKDRVHKDIDDWGKGVWGKVASPGVKCTPKRERTRDEWEHKLEQLDMRSKRRRGASEPLEFSP
ncbi:DNA ligase/mRNA capping enzyme [Coniophora puteana RWD-64-598 SS2]|uniref:DNA ligase/mRNA capping enzyme n=1 Tax=Coniophora puteana (strain RWD-64-598) TaxID=741705 RepID=A0A5M3MJL9_CONPW|nr:DNA ligase/mRNA capping enzyme [Coniophora puteana RWD-64-598 SS2]EIW79187.1 DNA ligase/mRNA capping enzyme [Coniophora puteana RWD-64-598 SS2]